MGRPYVVCTFQLVLHVDKVKGDMRTKPCTSLRLLNPGRRCLKMKRFSMIVANNVGVGTPLWVIAWGPLSRPSSNSACALLGWPGGAAVAKVMLFYKVQKSKNGVFFIIYVEFVLATRFWARGLPCNGVGLQVPCVDPPANQKAAGHRDTPEQ